MGILCRSIIVNSQWSFQNSGHFLDSPCKPVIAAGLDTGLLTLLGSTAWP